MLRGPHLTRTDLLRIRAVESELLRISGTSFDRWDLTPEYILGVYHSSSAVPRDALVSPFGTYLFRVGVPGESGRGREGLIQLKGRTVHLVLCGHCSSYRMKDDGRVERLPHAEPHTLGLVWSLRQFAELLVMATGGPFPSRFTNCVREREADVEACRMFDGLLNITVELKWSATSTRWDCILARREGRSVVYQGSFNDEGCAQLTRVPKE